MKRASRTGVGGDWAAQALASAKPAVFWSDREDAPATAPTLQDTVIADLTIIGGGFTGLWAAIQALEDFPGIRVVVLEAESCGFGASSRNGGFCDASLTHGVENGLAHWPDESEVLLRLGHENLDAIEATVARYDISADFRRANDIGVATEPWHLETIAESVTAHESVGEQVELLDARQTQKMVHSPTYLGGLLRMGSSSLVDPARLNWGLRRVAERLGAKVFERSRATSVEPSGRGLVVTTANGKVRSERVVVATNAYPNPIRRQRRYTIPVYDHVLITEPLDPNRLATLGWEGNEGLYDVSNQFHYYRRTEDDRILWGGYDATYHFNNGVAARHDQSEHTHGMLARQFFETFPQLEGTRFTHRWGGPVATTTRFTATWGSEFDGRLTWAAGYTGLGVGASRFGAAVALDLVFGRETERTQLEMVRKHPFPFPPEPIRSASVAVTRRAIQRADRREGKRGIWLRLLDRFGIGFDS